MKKMIYLLPVLLLVASGCENKKFEFNPGIKVNKVYEVQQTGGFSEFQTISHDEIFDLLDIPEEATIESVKIEAVTIYFEVLEGNQAESITLSGEIEESGVGDVLLFEDKSFSLGSTSVKVINSLLLYGGTEKIRSKLEKYLQMNDTNPFKIVLFGDTDPDNQVIHVSIHLGITGSVRYITCESVPWFIQGDGYCD
jgi:hypothetical protein